MSLVHLVRHAHAGDRGGWHGDDRDRPLTDKGRRQAAGIDQQLAGAPIRRVLSSPSLRCVQTVEPLARSLSTAVERCDALAEEASIEQAVALVLSLEGHEAVLCSHGDVIPGITAHLAAIGVELVDGRVLAHGDLLRCGKGSRWSFEVEGGRVVRGTYVPAPGKT